MPKRVDNNHAEIRTGLRSCGYQVTDLHEVGYGCPDLLVLSKSKTWVLLEVKDNRGKLTVDEKLWHTAHSGAPLAVVYSLDHAIKTMLEYDERLGEE